MKISVDVPVRKPKNFVSSLRSVRLAFSTAQLVRTNRYQQLAEGIERSDRRELEHHQMGFAEW